MSSARKEIALLVSSASKFITRRAIKSYFLPAMLILFIMGFFWNADYHELKRFIQRFLILPALISFQSVDYQKIYKSIPARFFILFLVYLCLSLFWSDYNPDDKYFEYISYIFYILFLVMIPLVAVQYNYKALPMISIGFIFIVTVQVLMATWLWYTMHPLTDRLQGHGTLSLSIQLATIYSAIAAFCVVSYLKEKTRAGAIYLAPFTICFGGIIFTGSRGPLLTLLAVTMLAALLIKNQRAKLLFALIVFIGLVFFLLEPNVFYAPLERGASFRPAIWKNAWHKIAESWVFGYGIATSPKLIIENQLEMEHYHNIFLATWFYGGIIGVLLLMSMVVTALVQGLRTPAAWPWLAAFISSLLCLLTNGNRLIYDIRPEWFYFWLPFAMILAYSSIAPPKRNLATSNAQSTE